MVDRFYLLVAVLCSSMFQRSVGGREIHNYAEMGACEKLSTNEFRCAMQSSDCEPTHIDGEKNADGEKWYTATRLRLNDLDPCSCENTPVGSCVANDGSDGSINYRCAANEESCLEEGESFDSVTSLTDDKVCSCNGIGSLDEDSNSWVATIYGACRDTTGAGDHFCAYHPDSCENSTWIEPQSVKSQLGVECHCENVRIGACIDGFEGGVQCAMTSDDCRGASVHYDPFHQPVTLKKKFGYSCRLCHPNNLNLLPQDEIDNIPGPTSAPQNEIDSTPGPTGATLTAPTPDNTERKGISAGVVAASAVGALVVALLAVAITVFVRKRCVDNKEAKTEFREGEESVTESVTVIDCQKVV